MDSKRHVCNVGIPNNSRIPSITAELNILDTFNIYVNIRQLIAQYDERIYAEFTYEDFVNMNGKSIMLEYNNTVYVASKNNERATMYTIIDNKLMTIHEYKTPIKGKLVSIICQEKYPQLRIGTSNYMDRYGTRIYSNNMISLEQQSGKSEAVPRLGSGREQCNILEEKFTTIERDIRGTSCAKWPCITKYYRVDNNAITIRNCVLLVCGEQTRDILYVYNAMYSISLRFPQVNMFYENALCVTDEYIYCYHLDSETIFMFSMETKDFVSRCTALFDYDDIFVKIIAKHPHIFILTRTNDKLNMHVYDIVAQTKINTVCIMTLNGLYTLDASSFAITDKCIYVYYSVKYKSDENIRHDHIMIWKRNSYFINK